VGDARHDVPLVALLLWVLLFCGSVVVPACVGLSLAAVAKAQRPVASSLSLLIGNLAGWFAGPLVSGFVATVMGDVQWGFRTTMMWSSLSLAFLLALRCLLPPPRRPGFAAECDDAVSVGP
jgi:MFS family permease